MKKFVFVLALLLIASFSHAGTTLHLFVGGGAAPASLCDNCEFDFEETGAPATRWTTSAGTINWDYSSSGLDMCNSEVVHLDSDEIARAGDVDYNHSELWFAFAWRFNDGWEVNDKVLFVAKDSTDTRIGRVRIDADETVECEAEGGSIDSGSTTFNANTTYRLKLYAASSSGSNDGTVTLWVWNGSSWVEECSSTNGTTTTNIDYFEILNRQDEAAEDVMFDCFLDSVSDITEP